MQNVEGLLIKVPKFKKYCLEAEVGGKEFMVQLQTFTTSDYLLKKIALIIINYKIERKIRKNYLIPLKQKYNFKTSRTCSDWSE